MKNNAQPRASRRAKQPWIDPSAALAELSLLAADQPIRPIEPRQKTPEMVVVASGLWFSAMVSAGAFSAYLFSIKK